MHCVRGLCLLKLTMDQSSATKMWLDHSSKQCLLDATYMVDDLINQLPRISSTSNAQTGNNCYHRKRKAKEVAAVVLNPMLPQSKSQVVHPYVNLHSQRMNLLAVRITKKLHRRSQQRRKVEHLVRHTSSSCYKVKSSNSRSNVVRKKLRNKQCP